MSRERQRGAGKIKALFTLLILAAMLLTILRVAPAFIDKYWVEDEMRNQARLAVVTRRTEEDMRQAIWAKIKEQEIKATPALKPEDIRIEYTGRSVNISLKYTVIINLYFYEFPLQFTPSAGDRPL